MTNKVILGLPFINALYPFLVEHDGITTNPFGQKVKFKFASKFEIDTCDALNLIHAKTKHINFLRQEVRYKKIAEQLSDKLLQSKIDNFQKVLIDDVCFDIPNAFRYKKIQIVNLSYVEEFPINVLIQEPMMGSCQHFADVFKGNVHSTKMLTTTNCPNILDVSSQESEYDAWISTTNKWNNNTYNTSKWINMASLAEMRNKGKAPTQGYSQDKRLPAGQHYVRHEGASFGVKPCRSTCLQEFVPANVTYSNGDMVVALQEVLSKTLQFHNGVYSELPNSIKFILDNLHVAFTLKHHTLFKKTLQALEIYLANLTAQNEAYASHNANLVSKYEAFESHVVGHPNITNDPYTSQLFGKEEIHSMDKKTIMGSDYARLSLKTQSLLRSAIANLPTEIQFSILESKAISGLLTYGTNISRNLLQPLFLILMI